MKYSYLVLFLFIGLAVVPNYAHAERGGLYLGLSADTKTYLKSDMKSDAALTESASVNSSTSVDVEGDANVETSVGEVRTDATTGTTISVAARSVQKMSDEEKQTFLATVKSSAEVQSSNDLELFAKGALIQDENLEAIESSESEVTVTYHMPVKLFGFIDITIPVTTTVSASAEGDAEVKEQVKAHSPWILRLFVEFPEQTTEADIEAAVAGQVASTVSANANFDVATQAKIAESVSTVLRVKHDTALQAAVIENNE